MQCCHTSDTSAGTDLFVALFPPTLLFVPFVDFLLLLLFQAPVGGQTGGGTVSRREEKPKVHRLTATAPSSSPLPSFSCPWPRGPCPPSAFAMHARRHRQVNTYMRTAGRCMVNTLNVHASCLPAAAHFFASDLLASRVASVSAHPRPAAVEGRFCDASASLSTN